MYIRRVSIRSIETDSARDLSRRLNIKVLPPRVPRPLVRGARVCLSRAAESLERVEAARALSSLVRVCTLSISLAVTPRPRLRRPREFLSLTHRTRAEKKRNRFLTQKAQKKRILYCYSRGSPPLDTNKPERTARSARRPALRVHEVGAPVGHGPGSGAQQRLKRSAAWRARQRRPGGGASRSAQSA